MSPAYHSLARIAPAVGVRKWVRASLVREGVFAGALSISSTGWKLLANGDTPKPLGACNLLVIYTHVLVFSRQPVEAEASREPHAFDRSWR